MLWHKRSDSWELLRDQTAGVPGQTGRPLGAEQAESLKKSCTLLDNSPQILLGQSVAFGKRVAPLFVHCLVRKPAAHEAVKSLARRETLTGMNFK